MDLPNPGIELGSPALQSDSLPAELPENPNIYRDLFYDLIRSILGNILSAIEMNVYSAVVRCSDLQVISNYLGLIFV